MENPIDTRGLFAGGRSKILTHSPGPETSGVVEGIGNQVTSLKDGDRAIYNRLFE